MTLRHELAGHGPRKVIVLHNWMATLRSYDPIRAYLDEADFTYAFVDHRGYGLNRHLDGSNTAAEAARDVVEVADALGWNRFHLIGHSMSGMVAQRVAVDATARVQSLLAITPVPASGVPLDEAGAALFRRTATDDESWREVARMITSSRLPSAFYDAALAHFRRAVSTAAYLRFLDMWTRTDFSAEMKNLDVPTLAVVGGQDFPAFREEAMQRTLGRWFRNFQIEVIDSSGHHPMAETPPYFVAVTERFMRTAA